MLRGLGLLGQPILVLVIRAGALLRQIQEIVGEIRLDDQRVAVDGGIPGRFHGVVIDGQLGGGFLNVMLQFPVQFGIEEPRGREKLAGLLQ